MTKKEVPPSSSFLLVKKSDPARIFRPSRKCHPAEKAFKIPEASSSNCGMESGYTLRTH